MIKPRDARLPLMMTWTEYVDGDELFDLVALRDELVIRKALRRVVRSAVRPPSVTSKFGA